MISSCGYWGLHDRLVNDLSHVSDRVFMNNHFCESVYAVKKSVISGMICYTVRNKKGLNWNRMQMTNSFDRYKPLTTINMNSSLLGNQFRVTMINKDDNVLSSLPWSATVMMKNKSIWYKVSYSRYHSKLLPLPYSNEGFTDQLFSLCIIDCVEQSLSKENKSLFGAHEKPNNLKLITESQRKQPQSRYKLRILERSCDASCSKSNHIRNEKKNLDSSFTITTIAFGGEAGSRNETALVSQSTDTPVLRIFYSPKLSLFEFIIQIGSIVSIWFGISVIQLVPFRKSQVTVSQIHSLSKEFRHLKTHMSRSRT